METDPDYEFEAPKWFDFTAGFDEELDDDSNPNDSWFERAHPLHEPKDPSFHDGTTKPLLTTTTQVNKTAPSNSKPQISKAKRNYNSKKSLGIKSIRTRRGQHDYANNRESSEMGLNNGQSKKADRQTCCKDGKNTSQGSNESGRETPEEINCNTKYSFTPPWTNLHGSLNKTEGVLHANKREGSDSNLSNAAVFSPQRVAVHQSSLSPAQVRILKSPLGSPLSPKSSLLSKAVSGSYHQAGHCGRKRRLLPAIPDPKQSPVGASTICLSPNRLPCHIKGEEDTSNPHVTDDQMEEYYKDTTCGIPSKLLLGKETQFADQTAAQEQHRNHIFGREDKQRHLEAILEDADSNAKPDRAFAPKEIERHRSLRSETETISNDTSLEALLKQHNKKVAAARSQYDENGRKIRTAEPNFCPAPSHKLSSSTACKRSTSSLEKPAIAAKQKRRSCVAAVSNTQSDTMKSKIQSINSSITNNKGKDAVNKQTMKQKRRSCAGALQHSGQVSNADKELRDLIAQHNSRVNAKKP